MSFGESLTQIALGIKADLEEKTRAKTKDLFTKIVLRTPVRTGLARSSWNVSVGQPDFSYNTALLEADSHTLGGPLTSDSTSLIRALAEIEKVDSLPVGFVVYLANGVPYIRLLEFGGYPNPPKKPTGKTIGGFSSQAPAGMVRISLLEVQGASGLEGEVE